MDKGLYFKLINDVPVGLFYELYETLHEEMPICGDLINAMLKGVVK